MRIKMRVCVAVDDPVAQKAHMHVMVAQHRSLYQRRVYDVFIISAVFFRFIGRNTLTWLRVMKNIDLWTFLFYELHPTKNTTHDGEIFLGNSDA